MSAYGEAQADWIKIHKIRPNSKVKVIRNTVMLNEAGFTTRVYNGWSLTEGLIYEIYVIWEEAPGVIPYLEIRRAWGDATRIVPFFILEPV